MWRVESEMRKAPKFVIARALRARGNLGKAVTFSPGVPCYPAVYREIATSEVRAILVMAGTYRQRLQCPLSHLR